MKRLLTTAAVCGLVVAASPAHAQVKLDLGGWFKGYGMYTDQDDDNGGVAGAGDSRELDMIRSTEIHFGGETTLDNGLTVGMQFETEADGNGTDGMEVQESYAYFSGAWGRVNVGAEDGAAYLLQVEAPSADSNLDGIRQYVNPVNYAAADPAGGTAALPFVVEGGDGVDYDQDASGYDDKVTYLSPIWSGFQLGLSYTPDTADASTEDALNLDNVDNAFGAAYEAGVRYEGMFNNVGVIVGAGYTHVDVEGTTAAIVAGQPSDDRQAWNAGIDLDIGPFGVGAAYMEDDYGDTEVVGGGNREEEKTFVVGADYTTGPFKLGASYLNGEGTANALGNTGNDGVETDRYTGGVVYTYGPGMTFRGSISYIDHDNVAGLTSGDSFDATSVLLGTQISF
ncbi:MAG: porin [Alphaproteobacteria bacterium]|nr:porin [Alphaproteobacteria bacterium]